MDVAVLLTTQSRNEIQKGDQYALDNSGDLTRPVVNRIDR